MALPRWAVGAAPFLAMIIVEFLTVGLNVINKAAMTRGMSNFVAAIYSNCLSVIVLLPFVIFRRKGAPITLSLVCRFFLLGLILSALQICVYTGLKYSSPTLSSAIGNLTPLFTYFLAIVTRMEKLDLKSSAGLAITLGAGVTALGASIATLYQGPAIHMSSYFHDIHSQSQQSNWAFGGLLFAAASVLMALSYIIIKMLVMEFPEKETIVLSYHFFSILITGIFSLFMETDLNAWKLTDDFEIFSILYTAIVRGVVINVIQAWCLKEKGVTYTVMFLPLGIVISMVMAVVFLGETLHIGSFFGGVVVTLGFYAVMWGKAKEKSVILKYEADVPESSSAVAPLLRNNEV